LLPISPWGRVMSSRAHWLEVTDALTVYRACATCTDMSPYPTARAYKQPRPKRLASLLRLVRPCRTRLPKRTHHAEFPTEVRFGPVNVRPCATYTIKAERRNEKPARTQRHEPTYPRR